MKDIINLKDYFSLENKNKKQKNVPSYNISPLALEFSYSSPIKYKNEFINNNIYKKEHSEKNINNNINEDKNIFRLNFIEMNEKIKFELEEIKIKINDNLNKIDRLKNILNELKIEKNKKKEEIVNLLSNRESVDEIYKNYIEYIKSKNRKKKNRNKKEIKNPFENQDEDSFEILINEIKQIDIFKFIEQSFNLLEELFESPKKQLKLELKEIINKSFSIFNNEIKKSNFIDTYSVVSNFFLRISIFLSNKSFGKYSETIINLFLRCLLKINSINVKNEELINYMNGKYKDEKNKLKEEIKKIMTENENLNINQIFLEKKMNELNKRENNKEYENNNNFKKIENLNNEIKSNNIKKKKIIKEKLKNKGKKIYQEDFEEKNGLDAFYYFTENKDSDKIENNYFNKLNKYVSNTDIKKINNFEIEQRYSFKINNNQNGEQINEKKYNTINFNEFNKISPTQNFEYTSPKVKNKKQIYYGNIKQKNNINKKEQGINGIITNEKKRNMENKRVLNYKNDNKNKLITFNDVKKNMKFDLAKKIKYLDKVSKNGMNSLSKTTIQNKKNKLIYEKETKAKRIFTTEIKEKVAKYNFFDIIQETNTLRNSSVEKNKIKNKLNEIFSINKNNILLRSSKGKKINGKYDISIKNNKKNENLAKSDYINNKRISFFGKKEPENIFRISTSIPKNKKNGIEKKESINNISDISRQKNNINNKYIIKNKKIILNEGPINKIKKKEIIKNNINLTNKKNNKKNEIKLSINDNNYILNKEKYFTEHNSNRSNYKININDYKNPENKSKIFNQKEKFNKVILLKKPLKTGLSSLINNDIKNIPILDSLTENFNI